VKELADGAGDQRLLGLGDVAEHVAREVHRAALPGAAEDLADRAPEPLVRVGDTQPDAVQAAGPQRAQELAPERLALGLADVEPEHLAAARLVHAIGQDQRLLTHAAGLSDALDLGVEP
jgi:hypothetical protein